MEKLLLSDIAAAIGCEYNGDDEATSFICSDSRAVTPGCIFVALSGESFDGHDYIGAALEQGAVMAVVMRDNEKWQPEKLFRVKDTRQAMLDIAGLYRHQMKIPVVAVTGSVGKTTTKEMIACVTSAGFKTLKTEANLNNEIGLSQTIYGITSGHEAAVLEMGMDGPGQIAPLSRAAAPNVGVLTNIGVSHLEALGSRENILREKLDITAGMPDDATLIINADDDLLATVELPRLRLMSYGINNPAAMVRAEALSCFSTHTAFRIRYNGMRYDASIPAMGEHNVYNALAAFCVGCALGIEPHRALAALRDYKPTGMRQRVVTHCGYTVVEDCYNASPDSMKAALKTLGSLNAAGKRIAILSDMLELGKLEDEAHREVGRASAECKIDLLYCTGKLSRLICEGAKAAGLQNAFWFKDKPTLFAALKKELCEEDICWVKASRGMHLEEVLEMIYKSN